MTAVSRSRLNRVGLVLAAALFVAALTGCVYLIRAGGGIPDNWPVQFELGSSDNGVLFQFANDVFRGYPLDWTFSPQVFVFPEIPISLLGYLVAGGSVQGYYLAVAMINNAVLFCALFVLINALRREGSFANGVARALVCATPLVVFPLVIPANAQVFLFQLAPTYYFGMYVAIIAAPLLFLLRNRVAVVLVGVAFALTIAANPLTLVFVLPAGACVGVVLARSRGIRAVVVPTEYSLAFLLLGALIRVTLLTGLEGESPLNYLSGALVPQRIEGLIGNAGLIMSSPVSIACVLVGLACFVGLAVMGIVRGMRLLRRRGLSDPQTLAQVYFGLAPVTALLASSVLLIINYLYLWPILVAPVVYSLLWIRVSWARASAIGAAGVTGAALVASALVLQPASPARYLSYRDPETVCLDTKLPAGLRVGYAGYFDARRLELTSTRPLLLIPLDYSGAHPYDWLTNVNYAREVGSFFFVDSASGQVTVSATQVTSRIGAPDQTVTCADGSSILIYKGHTQQQKISLKYGG